MINGDDIRDMDDDPRAKEYAEARRTAGEIVRRSTRGIVTHRLTSGITDKAVADVAFWFLKQNEALTILGKPVDDPLEPHKDPMRPETTR